LGWAKASRWVWAVPASVSGWVLRSAEGLQWVEAPSRGPPRASVRSWGSGRASGWVTMVMPLGLSSAQQLRPSAPWVRPPRQALPREQRQFPRCWESEPRWRWATVQPRPRPRSRVWRSWGESAFLRRTASRRQVRASTPLHRSRPPAALTGTRESCSSSSRSPPGGPLCGRPEQVSRAADHPDYAAGPRHFHPPVFRIAASPCQHLRRAHPLPAPALSRSFGVPGDHRWRTEVVVRAGRGRVHHRVHFLDAWWYP